MSTVLVNNGSDPDLLDNIVEAIRQVYDPEIPVNIYDLGLVYVLEVRDDDSVYVKMTLTTPNCPAAGILPTQVEQAVAYTEGVTDVDLQLTFDPPFSVDMMSDEVRLELGLA